MKMSCSVIIITSGILSTKIVGKSVLLLRKYLHSVHDFASLLAKPKIFTVWPFTKKTKKIC